MLAFPTVEGTAAHKDNFLETNPKYKYFVKYFAANYNENNH